MLLSLSNYGRTEPLTIVGPKGIEDVVYSIQFIELTFEDKSTISFQLGDFHISALPLSHALTRIGYSIIPREGKFDPQRANAQNIPVHYCSRMQKGENVSAFTPDMVLGNPRKGIKVSYITDTRPIGTIPEFIEGSDLFICEGMYGDDSDAARLAKAGLVNELWLTHYTSTNWPRKLSF